jgi:hypothetical protein
MRRMFARPGVIERKGTVSDTSLEVSGEGMHGGRMTVSFQKSADGLSVRVAEGSMEMRETYRRK